MKQLLEAGTTGMRGMVNMGFEEFMKLQKITPPNPHWAKQENCECFLSADNSFYKIYDLAIAKGYRDFKIFPIDRRTYWVLQVFDKDIKLTKMMEE